MVIEPAVRKYCLGRPLIAAIHVGEVIDEAVKRARVARPDEALGRFKFELRYLLPTDGRDLGDRWRPSEVLPRGLEGASVRDDWVRFAAYIGAIDGWTGAPSRPAEGPGPVQRDFAFFYTAAYLRVGLVLAELGGFRNG